MDQDLLVFSTNINTNWEFHINTNIFSTKPVSGKFNFSARFLNWRLISTSPGFLRHAWQEFLKEKKIIGYELSLGSEKMLINLKLIIIIKKFFEKQVSFIYTYRTSMGGQNYGEVLWSENNLFYRKQC